MLCLRIPASLMKKAPHLNRHGAFSSRVDDGIPPLGPRQSLCWRKGARREVSLRLCRMNCHRQFIPTTTASGCRGFESRHANEKKPRTLTGTGLFLQGWTMGFEPTTTGTTIRGSTAELRPPSSLHRSAATIYTESGMIAS